MKMAVIIKIRLFLMEVRAGCSAVPDESIVRSISVKLGSPVSLVISYRAFHIFSAASLLLLSVLEYEKPQPTDQML